MDLQSRSRWVEYSMAKDEMFRHTDIKQAPWYVVNGDDKKRARLNVIHHLLSLIPYEDLTPGADRAAAAGAGPRLRPPADGRADVHPRAVLTARHPPGRHALRRDDSPALRVEPEPAREPGPGAGPGPAARIA